LADGYFPSSPPDVATQNPSAIESMISSNGNGAYSVDFNIVALSERARIGTTWFPATA